MSFSVHELYCVPHETLFIAIFCYCPPLKKAPISMTQQCKIYYISYMYNSEPVLNQPNFSFIGKKIPI